MFAIANKTTLGDKTGVTNKVLGQVSAFESLGYSVSYIMRDDEGYWLMNNNHQVINVSNKQSDYGYEIKNEIAKNMLSFYRCHPIPDVMYVRGSRLFNECSTLFCFLKKAGTKIVIEIPTYIKLSAYKHPKEFLIESIDRLGIYRLKKYIDAIVLMANVEKLFGIRTIRINNGIDVGNIKICSPIKHDGIHMLGVAMMQTLHGYERIIEGLHQYYSHDGNVDVYLDLVGDGPETSRYKQLTELYGLQNRVIFHGVLHGEELDTIYNKCDLGVGAFGFYKQGITSGSILKIREYCAKGLPFIYACPEESFSSDNHFCKIFANDDSPINIEHVVDFYNSIIPQIGEIRFEMREYAINNLSWRKEMGYVLEQIEK